MLYKIYDIVLYKISDISDIQIGELISTLINSYMFIKISYEIYQISYIINILYNYLNI